MCICQSSGQPHTKTAPENDLQQSEPLRAVVGPKDARWVYVKAKAVCFGSPYSPAHHFLNCMGLLS
jgi:hypothetical protein